jgi:hypothetical protein
MKYFKLFVLWILSFIVLTLFGDYVISRNVNGYLQLLSFVGVVVFLSYVANETFKFLNNNKKTEK